MRIYGNSSKRFWPTNLGDIGLNFETWELNIMVLTCVRCIAKKPFQEGSMGGLDGRGGFPLFRLPNAIPKVWLAWGQGGLKLPKPPACYALKGYHYKYPYLESSVTCSQAHHLASFKFKHCAMGR